MKFGNAKNVTTVFFLACVSLLMVSHAQAITLSNGATQSASGGLTVISTGVAPTSGISVGGGNAHYINASEMAAAPVVYENVNMVMGSDGMVVELDGLNAGEYQLTLTDFVFPETFEYLGAVLTSATSKVETLILNGQEQASVVFDIAIADSYYLSVYGKANAAVGVGLYGIELKNLSVVPLPLSAALFLSGLGVVGLMRRKRLIKA